MTLPVYVIPAQSSAPARGIFLNSAAANCSIYESGLMFARALQGSSEFALDYMEIARFEHIPPGYDFYLFNYHHVTMRWLDPRRIRELGGRKLGLVWEMLPDDPLVLYPDVFDAYLVPDPTLECPDERVFAFPRPLELATDLPACEERDVPVIGSFGFATPGKGFDAVVWAAGHEFERAIVRLNIPTGTHADEGGRRARAYADLCRLIAKRGIELRIEHRYLSKPALVAWCAQNTVNVFLYHRDQPGLSATTDQAISSGRPLLVSPCHTFRHIHAYQSPYPATSIKAAIASGAAAVSTMQADWHPSATRRRFERVLARISSSFRPSRVPERATSSR
ncbi:MAG: hypothetical protein ACE5F1_15415 [Planctomycetota bacterium]